MTRLLFLGLLLVPAKLNDRGPTDRHNHITITRRGLLYCSIPGIEHPSPPLQIENNSPFSAQVNYQGEHFAAPMWSTTTWER